MCVYHANLNKVYLKDSYPLLSINNLVDVASGFRFLSFVDAYSGYNQIPMHPCDVEKNYIHNSPGQLLLTYQRLMNKVFANYFETLIEIYIDDMLLKTTVEENFILDLKIVLECIHLHIMRLNPQKCAFTVEVKTFLFRAYMRFDSRVVTQAN